MARLETVGTLRTSGWSLTILREGDEFSTFDEEMLADMREGAEGRMARALDHMVSAIKRTLSKQYPVVVAKGSQFATASGTLGRRKGERRQPSPTGAPPGRITGELMKSWRRRKPTWSKARTVLTGRYFSAHPAAGPLEFGSPKQKIPSRPYQRPTLVREADRLSSILDGSE